MEQLRSYTDERQRSGDEQHNVIERYDCDIHFPLTYEFGFEIVSVFVT